MFSIGHSALTPAQVTLYMLLDSVYGEKVILAVYSAGEWVIYPQLKLK